MKMKNKKNKKTKNKRKEKPQGGFCFKMYFFKLKTCIVTTLWLETISRWRSCPA